MTQDIERLIDNAATASQNRTLIDDPVTREAIKLNIIDPLLSAPAALKGAVAVPREFIEFVRNAPVSSGFCCCGGDMDKHGPFDGHSPTDQWEYSLTLWLEQIGYKP